MVKWQHKIKQVQKDSRHDVLDRRASIIVSLTWWLVVMLGRGNSLDRGLFEDMALQCDTSSRYTTAWRDFPREPLVTLGHFEAVRRETMRSGCLATVIGS